MTRGDPYEILGIGRDATPREVRAAFREVVRNRHPDSSSKPGEGPGVSEVIDAYHLLIDPASRARYDARDGPRSGFRDDQNRIGHNTPPHEWMTGPAFVCHQCSGMGRIRLATTCPLCEGRSEVTVLGEGRARILRCRACLGAGQVRSVQVCGTCAGSGTCGSAGS